MAGGVWQAGGGIVGADDGSLYIATGNGDEDPDGSGDWKSSNASLNNFGTHFVQFDPNLKVLGSFAPYNAVQMDKDDVDLGSVGPVLFPENSNGNILFGGAKDSRLFVLDINTHLGMRQIFQAGAPPDGINLGGVMADHHIHGSPVLWRSSKNGMNLYVWPERDFLRKFHWDDNAAVLDCKNKSGAEEKCQDGDNPIQQSAISSPGFCPPPPALGIEVFCPWSMPGGILSASAERNAAGTGIIWASMPKDADALTNVVPGELHALDADDITHELWNSEMSPARDGNFLFAKYNPPVIANGRVYMATSSNLVNVYGLRQWAKYIGDGGSPPPPALNPGKIFTTQVTMLNTGTRVWKKGTFRLGSQSPQDSTTWGKNRFELPNDVNPGDQATFKLTLTAPSQMVPGCQQDPLGRALCDYQWRMVEENIEWFGESTPKLTIIVPIPLTPRQCTVGLQCCESDGKGNCTLCAKVCQ